jgi:hypothetical protein
MLGDDNVISIVQGKLNAIKIATVLDDVPQNVNFAIKASVVANFLDTSGVITPGENPSPPACVEPGAKSRRVRTRRMLRRLMCVLRRSAKPSVKSRRAFMIRAARSQSSIRVRRIGSVKARWPLPPLGFNLSR